jgi:hypothetical protein
MVVGQWLTLRPKKAKVGFAFLVILSMWLSQLKFLCIFSPRYLAESVWFNTWPWMVYSLWIGDFLFVAMSTSHLSGLNLINQLFSHCCKLSKSLYRMAWSSVVLILLYRRQSSANSQVVDETTDGKSLLDLFQYYIFVCYLTYK